MLLEKQVIEPTITEEEQFISNFFLRPKSQSGKFRLSLISQGVL